MPPIYCDDGNWGCATRARVFFCVCVWVWLARAIAAPEAVAAIITINNRYRRHHRPSLSFGIVLSERSSSSAISIRAMCSTFSWVHRFVHAQMLRTSFFCVVRRPLPNVSELCAANVFVVYAVL